MSQIDNIFNQVRARLQAQSIKLWEEPYYSEGVGSIEASIEVSATRSDHVQTVSISFAH